MRRVLFIKPQPTLELSVEDGQSVERVFGVSLLFSGVRCTLQYAVLPFLLPLLGVAVEAATPFLLLLTLMAVVSIFFSLRRFWQINYTHRWQYLFVSVAVLIILVAFIIFDLVQMTA